MSILDQLNEEEKKEFEAYLKEEGANIEDFKIFTYSDGQRWIGYRSKLAKAFTEDGFFFVMKISNGAPCEGAPEPKNGLRPWGYLENGKGEETCLMIDREGKISAWLLLKREPLSADTLNGSGETDVS